jgi:hypothetical protein
VRSFDTQNPTKLIIGSSIVFKEVRSLLYYFLYDLHSSVVLVLSIFVSVFFVFIPSNSGCLESIHQNRLRNLIASFPHQLQLS